jgi:hypothetical protein
MMRTTTASRPLAAALVALALALCLPACLPIPNTVPIINASAGVPLYDSTLTLGDALGASGMGNDSALIQRVGTGSASGTGGSLQSNLQLVLEQPIPSTPIGDNLRLDGLRVAFGTNINDQLSLGSRLFSAIGDIALTAQTLLAASNTPNASSMASAPPFVLPFALVAATARIQQQPLFLPSSVRAVRFESGVLTLDITNSLPVSATLLSPQALIITGSAGSLGMQTGMQTQYLSALPEVRAGQVGIVLTAVTAQGADTSEFLPLNGSPTRINAGATAQLSFRIPRGTLIAQGNINPTNGSDAGFAPLRISFALGLDNGTITNAQAGIKVASRLEDVSIQSADVDFEPQTITIDRVAAFAQGTSLTRAVLKRFAGQIEVVNPFPIAAQNARLTIPALLEDGTPYTQTFSIAARSTTRFALGQAIAGRENRRYELFDAGSAITGLRTIIALTTDPIRGVLLNDSLRIRATVDTIPILFATGTSLPQTALRLARSVPFAANAAAAAALKKFRFDASAIVPSIPTAPAAANASLLVDSVAFDIVLRNQATIAGRVSGTVDMRTRNAAGSAASSSNTSRSALSRLVQIPPQAINPATIQSGVTTIRTSDRSVALLAVPDSISIAAVIETTNESAGGVLPRFSVSASDTISGSATVRIPLRVQVAGLAFRDTVALALPAAVLERRRNLAGGTLRLEIQNGIPAGVRIEARFLGAAGGGTSGGATGSAVLLSLPQAGKPALVVAPANPSMTAGGTDETTFSAVTIDLNAAETAQILDAQQLVLDLALNTPQQPTTTFVQFTTAQKLRVRAFVQVRGTTE